MAVISVARPQTTAEALGPIVADLFESIDRSKKLRGERLQFESVFKSLDSLGEEATPEEKMAAARGALQQVRTQARDQNEGFLARIIKGLDPRVPSFGEGVTPIEKFVADQQLGIAFSDTRLLDSQIELNKQRAAELERRPETGGAGLTAAERSGLSGIIESHIQSNEEIFNPGFKGKKQAGYIESFRNLIKDPSTRWQTRNRNQRIGIFNQFNARLVGLATKGSRTYDPEVEWNGTSPEVNALKEELFGTTKIPEPDKPEVQPTGGEAPQPSEATPPPGIDQPQTDEEIDAIPEGTRYWHPTRSPVEGPLIKGPPPPRPNVSTAAPRSNLPRVFPNNTAGIPQKRRSSRSPGRRDKIRERLRLGPKL